MYLISVKKFKIDNNFEDFIFNQKKTESMYITVITNNFFSDIIFSENKISINESPLNQVNISDEITYNKIEYTGENKEIALYKSTLSGRPVYYHFDLL